MNHVVCNCGAPFATIHELLEHRMRAHPPRVAVFAEAVA